MKRIVKLNPLELLAYAFFSLLTWPILFRDGMFMDAIQYTAVAKNLSEGYGSFWFPQLSYCSIGGLKAFHEHPPLVFGIEALFFKILGPGIFTERFYTALIGFLNIFLIGAVWKKACPAEWRKLSYVPMFLWILIIEIPWSFQNNMQENTMSIFVLLSVYFFLSLKNYLGSILSALFLLASFLCKGIPGLFPLIFPFLWSVLKLREPFIKAVWRSMAVLIYLIAFSFILCLLPEAYLSLKTYLVERVLHRITQDPVVSSRFYIFWKWLQDLSVVLLISFVLLIVKRKEIEAKRVFNIDFCLWLIFGFCGVLPMMLTLVQRGFYMVPSFPFFAIAFSFLVVPIVLKFNSPTWWHRRSQWILTLLVFILGLTFAYVNFGKIWREREQMILEHEIGPHIPKNEIVGADASLWDNWTFQTALMRYHRISIVKNDPSRNYYIDAPGGMQLPADYKVVYTSKSGVRLLKKGF
jgi:hypothetical protein